MRNEKFRFNNFINEEYYIILKMDGQMAHACNPSIWEAGRSGSQSPWLHNKFQATLAT